MPKPSNNEPLVYQAVLCGDLKIDDEGRIWKIAYNAGNPKKRIVLAVARRAESRARSGYLRINLRVNGIRSKFFMPVGCWEQVPV